MSAADDMRRIGRNAQRDYHDVFTRTVDLAHDSIQNGSPLTGAPGQQVDQGTLRASWQKWYPSSTEAMIATDRPYAQQEEDGISYAHGGKPIVQRSQVGGPHSRKLTVAGMQRIVDQATAEVGSRRT